MKYIFHDDDGWHLYPYFEYAETISAGLSPGARALTEEKRHGLDDKGSFHDAWIRTLSIEETLDEDSQPDTVNISLVLLGPYHDRLFHVRYENVRDYSVHEGDGIPGPFTDRLRPRGHDDLLVHELRLSPKGEYVHEMIFASETTIWIEAAEIRFFEEMLGQD